MQLTGSSFTLATALAGNDLATFPDFPAEIRAPIGTTFGVSAFQINFGAREVKTSGDTVDVLIAMNPAALKVNLSDVHAGGLLLVDSGTFTEKNLRKAGYDHDPLEDGSLKGFRVVKIDMSQLTLDALKDSGLSKKDALRCKNMWALGLVYWIFDRDRQSDRRLADQEIRQDAGYRRRRGGGVECRACLRRDGRDFRRYRCIHRAPGGHRRRVSTTT